MEEDKKRVSFNDDESDLVPQKKVGKLNKSQFVSQSKIREAFDAKADNMMHSIEDRRQRALDLTKQFWDIIRDKTIVENKGPLTKSLEQEITNKLITYAIEVNGEIDVTDADGNVIGKEHEGMGSISIIALMLKVMMHQRDLNNKLELKVTELEAKINSLLK